MGSPLGPQGGVSLCSLGFLLISGVFAVACVNKTGETLPPALMTFPIAIELSLETDEPPDYVFVANSNFALQFNTGTVQSYDLQILNEAIDSTGQFAGEGCVGAGFLNACVEARVSDGIEDRCLDGSETSGCECDPGTEPSCTPCDCDRETDGCDPVPPDRCSVLPPQLEERDQGALLKTVIAPGVLISEAEIGSFADGLGISTQGNRLYIPVRSSASLAYVDVQPTTGLFDCGSGFVERQSCDPQFRTGSSEQANPDPDARVEVPPDPVDVFAGNLAEDFAPPGEESAPAFQGDYILVAHREAEASLYLDQSDPVGEPVGPDTQPRIVAALDGLADEQVTVTYQPGAKKAWISSQLTNQVVRVGVGIGDDPLQSDLFNAGTFFVTGLDRGDNMRDIQFDPRSDSNLAYLLSRSPQSLVVARSNASGSQLEVVDQISVCRGPSRLKLVELPARGTMVLTAFVSCFDQRMVQIVDLDLLQSVTILTNISGSFEFVVDALRSRIYVADFSTSVLRIADLTPTLACLEGSTTGTGGTGGGGGAGGSGGGEETPECSPRLLGLVGLPQPVSEFPR